MQARGGRLGGVVVLFIFGLTPRACENKAPPSASHTQVMQ